jgi:hypothetical protein
VVTPFRTGSHVWTYGTIDCTDPASDIYLTVQLARNSQNVSVRSAHNSGQVPPPGYYPPSGTIWDESPAVTLADPLCLAPPPLP